MCIRDSLYNNRKEYKLNGFALGVTYNPSFHPLHFHLHMQMLEQQIGGSQGQVLGVIFRYHP